MQKCSSINIEAFDFDLKHLQTKLMFLLRYLRREKHKAEEGNSRE